VWGTPFFRSVFDPHAYTWFAGAKGVWVAISDTNPVVCLITHLLMYISTLKSIGITVKRAIEGERVATFNDIFHEQPQRGVAHPTWLLAVVSGACVVLCKV
jgi:hypothetical protein